MEVDGVVGQALGPVTPRHLAPGHRTDHAVGVADGQHGAHRRLRVQRWLRQVQQCRSVERLLQSVVLRLPAGAAVMLGDRGLEEDPAEVDVPRLPVIDRPAHLDALRAPHHLVEGAEAQLRHVLAHFLGDEAHEVHHVLGLAGELRPQPRVLRGDSHRAGIQVAGAHHDAAERDQRARGEAKLLGAEQGTDDDVPAGLQLTVHLDRNAAAQVVQDQHLMGLGEAQLPGNAGVLDRRQRGGAGAAVMTGDQHHVGVRLGDAGGDGPDPQLRHQLHADAGVPVRVLQVVDQLLEILDGVDVVVRRRRDQSHAGSGVAHFRDPRIDLGAGKLAPFPGLGALRDLDLQLPGVDQVVARHAEPRARHLLDGGVLRVAVRFQLVPGRILAAFAGIRLAADAVHGHGEHLVRFLGDGAVAHRARLEAAHDRLDRLDLVEAHRLGGGAEVHQAAQRAELLRLIVDQRRVLLEGAVASRPAGVLQLVDGLRIHQVELASGAVLVLAARGEAGVHDGPLGRKAALVAHPRFLGDDVDADSAHARRRPGEVLVDEVLREPDRLEDLRAVVALHGADPHLGDHLHHPLGDRLQVLLLRVGGGTRDQALLHLIVHGLHRQVRVHRAGAVPDEQREVMHLARLPALHDQRAARPRSLADQVVVQRGHRQQRGNRRRLRVVAAIREHQQIEPFRDALGSLPAQVLERAAQRRSVAAGLEQGGKLDRLEPVRPRAAVERADPRQLVVGEDGRRQRELAARLRPGLEQIALGSDRRLRRHDDLFADRVDGRIGDLREELLEVVEEELRSLGQHGEWRVGPHRTHGLVARGRHGRDQELHVLGRVPEDLLPANDGLAIGMDRSHRRRQILDADHRFAQPFAVGRLPRDTLLELLVGDDALLLGVDEEDAARRQPPLLQHFLGGDVEDADFGGHHHQVVGRDVVTRGPKAVAIEHGAHANAVGECDGSRPVPGLHQA